MSLASSLAPLTVLDLAGSPVSFPAVWAGRTTILVFIRHFGCAFCREQVTELTRWVPRFAEAGAALVVIGQGTPEQAAAFHHDRRLPFPVYTDPTRVSYVAAGLLRGWGTTLSLRVVLNAWRALRAGHTQGPTQGNLLQEGGVFVLRPDGELLYAQVSAVAGDHADPAEILAAVSRAD